jgi:hypothetical protein
MKNVVTSTVIRLPPEFDVVEEEGQPSWLFAAEERLQCNRKNREPLGRDGRARQQSTARKQALFLRALQQSQDSVIKT